MARGQGSRRASVWWSTTARATSWASRWPRNSPSRASGSRSSRRSPHAGPYLAFTAEAPLRATASSTSSDVDVVTDHVVTPVEPGRVSGSAVEIPRPAGRRGRRTASCSSRSALSDDALYHELRDDPERLEREGISGLYPDRRLRRAAADRGLRLRRPSPRPGDRLRRSGHAASVRAREGRAGLYRRPRPGDGRA